MPNLLMVIPTCKTLRCLTSLSSLAAAESLEVRVNHRSARSFLLPWFPGYYADPSEPSRCQVEPCICIQFTWKEKHDFKNTLDITINWTFEIWNGMFSPRWHQRPLGFPCLWDCSQSTVLFPLPQRNHLQPGADQFKALFWFSDRQQFLEMSRNTSSVTGGSMWTVVRPGIS